MNETAGMLSARLGLIERIRRVEHMLARAEQARIAAQLMKGYSHELGNQVQIVKLSALELARRVEGSDVHGQVTDLLADMTAGAEAAAQVLYQMFAAARPADLREVFGPPIAHAIRSAVDLARPALASQIELRVDLADDVVTWASAEEVEALVLAALVDVSAAANIKLLLRERMIQNKRWVELLRLDDRHGVADGELAHMFEPHSLLHVVSGVAKAAGGDASLAPGRGGLELAVEMPVASARLL